jgi:hypothetical protein
VWGPDGRELFYRGGSADRLELVRVQLRTTPELEVVSREPLFTIGEIAGSAPHGIAVAAVLAATLRPFRPPVA